MFCFFNALDEIQIEQVQKQAILICYKNVDSHDIFTWTSFFIFLVSVSSKIMIATLFLQGHVHTV